MWNSAVYKSNNNKPTVTFYFELYPKDDVALLAKQQHDFLALFLSM